MIYNVAVRFIFNKSFIAVEDYSKTCFVWMCFIGASLVFKERSNIAITAVANLIPPQIKKYVDLLVKLAILAFVCFVCYASYKLTVKTKNTMMIASHMSQAVLYSALPIGTAMMAIHVLDEIAEDIDRIIHGRKYSAEVKS